MTESWHNNSHIYIKGEILQTLCVFVLFSSAITLLRVLDKIRAYH